MPDPAYNIFRALRHASNLSHEKLATQMNTSKHALIRLEQGLYERPLPTAVNYWLNEGRFLQGVKNSGIRITELTLVEGYEHYQEETREQHKYYFGPNLNDVHYGAGFAHPFLQLKKKAALAGNNATGLGIAKALCVPQASLNVWENRWRSYQKSVPKTFQSALLQIGYDREEVRAFNLGFLAWRENNK
jgi:transcriptional regulator with XRE-family HTH domain